MLYRFIPYCKTQNEVYTNVVSPEEDISLGSLIPDFYILIGLQMKDTKPETVESIRQVFKADTLGNYTTFVEKAGTPIFV